jgi:FAD/FMN-containing dehydrogenase
MSYDSWGRNVLVSRAARAAEGMDREAFASQQSWLPFGNGRSYGDSCHNDRGMLIDCRGLNRILAFDENTAELTCGAGVLLSDILAYAIPRGYFLPVTPGTRYVTVAGAIANDVHGKNHHVRGTFGMHVSRFTLIRSDGETVQCSANSNATLYSATIGGMGLTGLITEATIKLMRVGSANIRQRTLRFDHLEDYFAGCGAFDEAHEYAVAWIDQSARGRHFGRGILMGGDHAEANDTEVKMPRKPRLSVPFTPPINLINRFSLKAFNALYFAKEKPGDHTRTVPWSGYFYPLDAVGHWNRLYGPKGLFQHQSIYPEKTGHETTVNLLECAQEHGHASFLTVLKRFGTPASPGILSFPRPGFTLTLDFANQGPRTMRMLDALDQIVIDAGGAINPYKDGRMQPETFGASFPRWPELESNRDPAMMSDFWRRTAMVLAGSAADR